MLIYHLYILFGEVSVRSLAHFLTGALKIFFFVLLLSFKSFLRALLFKKKALLLSFIVYHGQ